MEEKSVFSQRVLVVEALNNYLVFEQKMNAQLEMLDSQNFVVNDIKYSAALADMYRFKFSALIIYSPKYIK
jgi:hypothetical protein